MITPVQMVDGQRYKDRVTIITGGARGIGEGIARLFAKHGSKVVAVDKREKPEWIDPFNSEVPGNVDFYQCDLTEEESVKAMIQYVVDEYQRLDCLINNAGWHPPHKPIEDFSLDEMKGLMDVNLHSQFLTCKYGVPHIRQTQGNIINMSSMTQRLGQLYAVTYVASKSQTEEHPPVRLTYRTLSEAFEDQAHRNGSEIALIRQNGETLSFKEMNDLANKLADRMIQFENKWRRSDDRVASLGPVLLAMEPGVERIVAVLALWKAKSYFVPVEKCLPKNRIKLMIREIRPSLVLTSKAFATRFAEMDMYSGGLHHIDYDSLLALEVPHKPDIEVTNESDVACVFYTSGSTGRPKGVALTHGNLLYRLEWQWKQFPVDSHIGIAKTSFLFLDSVTEIWSILLKGRSVVVMDEGLNDPNAMIKVIDTFNVTRLVLVPSLLAALIACAKMLTVTKMNSLKEVISSGERLALKLAREFFNTFDGKKLINQYGTTEITGDGVFIAFENIAEVEEAHRNGSAPIGKPIDGVKVTLEDEEGSLVDVGETGEIVVRGPTVMKGYVGSGQTTTHYRTGDFAVMRDGILYFVGRKDDRVKIRGQRVDCHEIEVIIRTAIGSNVSVMVVNADKDSAKIVAFVEGSDLEAGRAERTCQQELPTYQIPRVVPVAEIPLTETGKIDRQGLQYYYNSIRGSDKGEYGIDEKAMNFLKVVAEAVDIPVDRMCLDQRFSDLGGNSINKIKLAATLAEQYSEFIMGEFIRATTIREMYDALGKEEPIHRRNTSYDIVNSKDCEDCEPVEMIAKCFSGKDPFVISCMKTSSDEGYQDLIDTYTPLTSRAMEEDGLFVIKNKESGEYVAAIAFMDQQNVTFERIYGESIALVIEIIVYTDSFQDAAPEGAKLLDFMAIATADGLSTEENLTVTQLAEEFVIDTARKRGYYAVIAQNTNVVTQHLAERLGYVTKGSFKLVDYTRPDGSKPLADIAPPDVVIKSMIKYL